MIRAPACRASATGCELDDRRQVFSIRQREGSNFLLAHAVELEY
jgi:hypothetical protein